MTANRSGPGHEGRVLRAALGASLPGAALALLLLWTGDFSLKVQVTASVVVVLPVILGLTSLHEQVLRPLQAIANLIAAVREGDFSVRGRRRGAGEALGAIMTEINLLGDSLRQQRLGAVEASTLLGKVMAEIDVAIFAFDERQHLRLVNPAGERLLGQAASPLVGRSAARLGMDQLLGGAAPRTLKMEFPGGRGLWQLRRTDFRQSGRPHTLVVLADVHRALRDEERQAWQRLVRVLGHEINNSLAPISSIAGSLQQLLRRRPDDWEKDMTRGLSVVERRADGLGRFMTAYAQLARLPPPALAPVDVAAWLQRASVGDPRVAVAISPGPGVAVLGDQDQLDQLLINLIRNAGDAALATGGTVTVTWRRAGRFVEVLVVDDGPGIGDGANLFVPFFTTKPNGSGIGLVLSRQIAEAHRGSLELRNRSERSGCEALLRLPL